MGLLIGQEEEGMVDFLRDERRTAARAAARRRVVTGIVESVWVDL